MLRRLVLLAMLCGGPAAAQMQDPSFRLVNASGTTIQHVYVSSVAISNWGQDRLGNAVLPHGRSVVIRLPMGQCQNDVLVVYEDGQRQERRNVDTCSIMEMVFP